MPIITLSALGKIAGIDAITALIDAGTTDATGDMQVVATDASIIATIPFAANPSFNAATGGGASSSGSIATTTVLNSALKTMSYMIFRNRDNTEVFRSNIGILGSGADILAAFSRVTLRSPDRIKIPVVTLYYP